MSGRRRTGSSGAAGIPWPPGAAASGARRPLRRAPPPLGGARHRSRFPFLTPAPGSGSAFVRITVAGSIATGQLTVFPGRFANQPTREQLEHVSLSSLTGRPEALRTRVVRASDSRGAPPGSTRPPCSKARGSAETVHRKGAQPGPGGVSSGPCDEIPHRDGCASPHITRACVVELSEAEDVPAPPSGRPSASAFRFGPGRRSLEPVRSPAGVSAAVEGARASATSGAAVQ